MFRRTVRAPEASSVAPGFDEVFAEHGNYVVRSLLRLGVHVRDLEDVAQETFLAVAHQLERYDPSRPIRPWLFAFAFRAASNYRRSARFRREKVVFDESPEERSSIAAHLEQMTSPEDDLLRAELRSRLLRALETLDLPHRAVIALVDIDGVAPLEAAVALGIPVNTVYSRVRNGRSKLRAALSSNQTGGTNDDG